MRQYIDIILAEDEQERQVPRGHTELPNKPSTPMTKKKVLYRSVSLPELQSIWRDGSVRGGQNSFNEFDPRKWVFFGPELTDYILWQGEDIGRWASFALTTAPIQHDFQILKQELEEAIEMLSEIARAGMEKVKDKSALNAQIFQELEDDWQNRRAVSSARNLIPAADRTLFRQWEAKIYEFRTEMDELAQRYREEHQTQTKTLKDWRNGFPISSAVIRTKPITGGNLYKSRNPEVEDEYGFMPGEVTFFDIDHIYLVKDSKVVGELDPYDLGTYLSKIGLDTA